VENLPKRGTPRLEQADEPSDNPLIKCRVAIPVLFFYVNVNRFTLAGKQAWMIPSGGTFGVARSCAMPTGFSIRKAVLEVSHGNARNR
jgi:hypothetical protein